jgi:hypothetical protein
VERCPRVSGARRDAAGRLRFHGVEEAVRQPAADPEDGSVLGMHPLGQGVARHDEVLLGHVLMAVGPDVGRHGGISTGARAGSPDFHSGETSGDADDRT